MPYPLDTDSRADLLAGKLASATLIDLYCKTSGGAAQILRGWTRPGELTYPADEPGVGDVTYRDLHGRVQIDVAVRHNATWSAEPLTITFDRSRATDDDDFTGQFTDAVWHQRKVRVRTVLLNPATLLARPDPVWEWRGRMDARTFGRGEGVVPTIVLQCESGFFRVRGRNFHTRTDADQRRRKADDPFFALTPLMISRPPLWMRRAANVPGTFTSLGRGGYTQPRDGNEKEH